MMWISAGFMGYMQNLQKDKHNDPKSSLSLICFLVTIRDKHPHIVVRPKAIKHITLFFRKDPQNKLSLPVSP